MNSALYLANYVVTLRAELAADGSWLELTDSQRKIIENKVNKAREYIEDHCETSLKDRVNAARMV